MVNENKQTLFLHRVFLLHEVALKRGGKQSTARLNLVEWNLECDRCCVIAHILDAVEGTCDDDGNRAVSESVMHAAYKRAVEGSLTSFRIHFFFVMS